MKVCKKPEIEMTLVQKKATHILNLLNVNLPKSSLMFFIENTEDELVEWATVHFAKKSRLLGFKTQNSTESNDAEMLKSVAQSNFKFDSNEKPLIYSRKRCVNIKERHECVSLKYFIVTSNLRLINVHMCKDRTVAEILIG